MKLILSSCDFRNDHSQYCILDNLGMLIQNCRVLYFPNEKATREEIESDKYHLRLAEFGFNQTNMFVFNYYDSCKFSGLDIDAIYISGGNTFATFDRIKKSGFDLQIIEYVKNGAVYIGGSAGAHIASKNIEHVMQYDNNTPGITDFDGLGLFNGILICHYTESRKEHLEQLKDEDKYKIYTLTEDDFIVVKDCLVSINRY
ncbi:MAG: Type 1 glutamine amidotransferase-like domain-containing protein [Eubacteriales bacterium]